MVNSKNFTVESTSTSDRPGHAQDFSGKILSLAGTLVDPTIVRLRRYFSNSHVKKKSSKRCLKSKNPTGHKLAFFIVYLVFPGAKVLLVFVSHANGKEKRLSFSFKLTSSLLSNTVVIVIHAYQSLI